MDALVSEQTNERHYMHNHKPAFYRSVDKCIVFSNLTDKKEERKEPLSQSIPVNPGIQRH